MKVQKKHYKFKFIDLFAGIGGIRTGLESVGGASAFSSEWDKFACQTYFDNYNELPFGDITKINENDIPKHDLIAAGFPCQPFSNAGRKKGFADTRGTLFLDIVRIAKKHRPKVLFLENVKNLATHDGGNTLRVIKENLEGLGYTVNMKVLNAKDFGLPQNRERIFIICFLGDYKFNFPSPTSHTASVGDILEEEVDEKYTLSDKLWAGHQRRKKEHIKKGNGFGYSLFNATSEYTSTISARYYKDGSEILIEQANKNPRKVTPREAARLQGYGDDFIITVSDTQAYKQFGNSVAVPVIKAISKEIIKTGVFD